MGSTYGSRGDFIAVLKAFERGSLLSVIDKTVKLTDLPKAHDWLEERKVFGKVVVVM